MTLLKDTPQLAFCIGFAWQTPGAKRKILQWWGGGWSPSDFRGPKTGLHYLKTKMHAFLIKQTTFGVHPVPVCSWDMDFLRGWLQKIVLDFMWNAGHMVAQWLLLLPHSKEVTGSHSCWTISVLSLHALPLCTRVFCRFSGFPPRVQKHACVG